MQKADAYVIRRHTDQTLFAGINRHHAVVSWTKDVARAKTFASMKKAIATIEKYAGAGYGLSLASVDVVNVDVLPQTN